MNEQQLRCVSLPREFGGKKEGESEKASVWGSIIQLVNKKI